MIYIINPHVRTLNEDPIIQIKNLRKKYGKVDAVSGITFNVESGKLFAFFGTQWRRKIDYDRYDLHSP